MNLAREQEALAHVRRGRPDLALEILMITYEVQLTSYIARLVYDRERVKDLYQDVFFQVFQGIGTFEGRNDSSLWSWICSIAYYRFLDEQKRLALRASPVAAGDLTMLDDQFGPAHSMRTDEQVAARRALEQCLAGLHPEMRARVMMRLYLGLSHTEIGKAIGKATAAAQVGFSRLQKKLRECLRGRARPGRA